MNLTQTKTIASLFGLLLMSSCGKDYDCVCVGTSSVKNASSVTVTRIETVSSNKYRKQETARLMCENVKSMSSTSSTTLESVCTLK